MLVVGVIFAASVLAADQFALSFARFTEDEAVTGNMLTTSTLGTPTGLDGTVICSVVLLRANELVWIDVPNAAEYTIERAVGAGAFTTLASVALPVYSDTAVTAGTYKYRVATTRNQWTSPVSSSITLVQPAFCL